MAEPARQSPLGQSPPRPDGRGKVTGETLYLDDLPIEGVWFGATVRSDVPAGRVRGVDAAAALALGDVVVVTAADLPGPNELKVIELDWPVLAGDRVEHIDQPIALVAAPTRELARRAAELVRVDVEADAPVLTVDDRADRLPSGRSRELARGRCERGDVDRALSRAPIVVEGEYETGHQEHVYIEPQAAAAIPHADGTVEIVGSIQCPYYVHGALEHLFGEGAVRVRQAPTGGGFGGKEEFPDMLCAHVALLARAAGRPVKIVYERGEDIRGTTKRHPSRVRVRSGHTPDGALVALEIDATLDGGAYTTLSPVVLSRALLHAGGPYQCPDVRITGVAIATNTPPNGAFRGFGAPQTQFAMERHMDRAARAAGVDPLAIRERNAYRPGDVTPTGQVLGDDTSALDCLRLAAERTDFRARWTANEAARAERHARGEPSPGIGLSLFWHGTGFTGNGERVMRSPVHLALLAGGDVEVRVASTDFGQGTEVVLPQIVADALGVPLDRVRYAEPDTARVPNSGPTVASRTVHVVGGTLARAARELADRVTSAVESVRGLAAGALRVANGELLDERGVVVASFDDGAAALLDGAAELEVEARYEPDVATDFDDATYRGAAYATYGYGCDVVEVDVCPDTLSTRVRRATFVADVGRAIHPVLCAGQLEGGGLQAIGMGTIESITLKDGRYEQDRLTNCLIPTAQDAPEMETLLLEHPSPLGPSGAKGVGELPADGGAPAVVAAIENATGIACGAAPAIPERLFDDLRAGRVVPGGAAADALGLERAS